MALDIIICVMTEEFLDIFFYYKDSSKKVAAIKFAQRVYGFDLIRAESKSYVIDAMAGFS